MRQLIFLFIATFAFSGLLAQSYSFQQIGVEEGLSQSVVNCVVQDDEGVFWIGTMSGLTRYDGRHFKVYTKSEGLSENWVTAALKDKNGNLWFGHWGGGVSFYNKKLEKMTDLKLERFSNFKSITSMILDKNNDIWFGTNGAGVFKYEFESNNVVSFSKEDGFQSSVVKTMCLDGKGNIWFGTNKGIAIYRISKELEDKGAFLLITQKDGLSANQITDIQRLGNDAMAVGTEYNGLTVVGNTKDLSQMTFRVINQKSGLLSNDILCIYAENEENLWMGTRNEGVIRFNLKTGDFRQLSTKQGLNYFKINVIFSDREQNIWIGTDLGLNLFRGEGFLIYDERDGLLNNVIWDISEDNQRRLYLATNQGLSRIKFIKNKDSDYTERLEVKNFDQNNGMSNEIALSVLIDNDGDIWCGTGFGGLNYIPAGSERVSRVLDSSRGLSSNTIYSITQDKQGYVWVGTNTGASRIDKTSFEVKNFSPADGLGGDNIYKVFCDSKGMIWFASIGGFLTKYQDGTFIRFDSSYQVTQKFITSVTEDPQGNIWFGAYGGGVYKYDGQSFDNFTQKDGLSSNSPYSLIADDLGNLWIGTSQGIDKLNIAERSVKNYRKSEGFMGIEPNPNAVWKDHNGNIWFGTIMGAVKFDLSKDRINQYQPVTVVERLQINREIFNFPEDNVFAYDENHLTFEYIGISLTNPEHVQYKYMLEGFDRDWSPVTSSNDVVYSNLPSGDYTFKVLASNNDGVWNELPTTYAFRIKPPFWQTWWFYGLSFIVIVGIIYLIFQLRVKNLVAAKEKLEQMVEERTQEIIAKNIELERKNKDILDSINYAKRIQAALLPSEKKVREHLSNSFIFFKPKDIVSGDFYWMERIGNKVLFAAADCTGHGVPGAFMSFIGHNGLNKAVIENDILTPSKILDLLNREVNETLKQEEEREVKDGMDIAMCSLDIETLELEFAGAFNPLYLVRDGEVQEFKGDRRPIGSFPNDKERLFANHKMKLKKGDALYIFSDGFPDQFGGPDGKKFRYKQFREILVECQEKDMNTMDEYLENVMADWMGEFEQIDDVVIIGVKIA